MRDQVDDLIEAGRILDQHHARLCLTELELLGTAEAAFELRKRADGGLLVDADNVRDSGFCGGVVDVVAARQVDVYLVLVTEDVQYDVGRVRAGGEHLGDSDLRRLAMVAALRAAEAAEMAVGDVVVLIFGLAVDAVRRVGQLVRGLLVDRDIHAEPDDLVRHAVRKGSGERAVRVQAERCIRHMRDTLADSVERVRNFAVAVKLVAEDVVDDQTFDRQVFARFAEGCLVALDERVRVRALPDSVECCANTAMMPVSRFAPDLLEKYLSPASANACSIMREVVVLPFVPVTTVTFTPRDSSPRIFFINFQCQLAR